MTQTVEETKEVQSKIVVERNDVPWTFVRAKLKKKNKADPDRYAFVPEKPTSKTEDTFLTWVGKPRTQLLYRQTRQFGANWTESATNDDGEFSETEFVKYASKFSARGETLKLLELENKELMNEVISITRNTQMTSEEKDQEMKRITDRLLEIQEAQEHRKRTKKTEGEEEEPEVEE